MSTLDRSSLFVRQLRPLLLTVCLLLLPALAQAAPVALYSDLDSGPNVGGENNAGVYVTVWGRGFGSTRGTGFVSVGGGQVANYPLWSDTKIIFQLGAGASTGNIAVRTSAGDTSNGIPFTVRTGRIFFVTPTGTGSGTVASPMSPSAAYGAIQTGDTFYYRAGTYSAKYGDLNWSNSNYSLGPSKSGTLGNPVAFVGYPNEVATFQGPGGNGNNFNLRDSTNTHAGYVTIANLTLVGGSDCIGSGGVTVAYGEQAKSGAPGMRVVGNILRATYTGNTMTAIMQISNDGARVYGNEFKDTGTTPPLNQNHTIYVNLGASDVDIAWNYLHDLRMGHLIQIHTDTYFSFYDVRVHDNIITAGTVGDSRAINVGNANGDSYGSIYNNIIDGVGGNFSAIAIWSGTWKIYNNTMHNIHTPGSYMIFVTNAARVNFAAPASWLPAPTVEIKNNIFYSDGSSPYFFASTGAPAPTVTMDHNLYFNNGAPPAADTAPVTGDPMFILPSALNFRLTSGSPAIDGGSQSTNAVVMRDNEGNPRPQGVAPDIGALESPGSTLPTPQNVRITKK